MYYIKLFIINVYNLTLEKKTYYSIVITHILVI